MNSNSMACLCVNSQNLWFPHSSPRLSPKCVLSNPNSLPLLLLLNNNNNTHAHVNVTIPFLNSPLPKMMPCSIPSRRSSTTSFVTVTSNMAPTAESPISDNRMLVFVPPHPLIKHWVSILRNEQTPSPVFRSAMAELGRLLMYEASRDWLPTVKGEIQAPMGLASVEFVDPKQPVEVIPILRAGLALSEHASSILPATKTYHIGIRRDEETLLPTTYLNKLPEKFPEGSRVFVVDPILATGGTIVAALELVKERGVENKQIKVISALSAPPALTKLSEKFPGIHVYTGIIDPVVNDKGWIIPGLGDAGDRSFGTS